MNDLKELLTDYLSTKQEITENEALLDELKKSQKERVRVIIEMCQEYGVNEIEIDGTICRPGFETTYTAIGGELKNPEKRRELFERIFEGGFAKSEKIVFKDSFYITEDGAIGEAKDAAIDGRNWKKLIEDLPEDFKAKLIDDGLLGFYTVPKIEVK